VKTASVLLACVLMVCLLESCGRQESSGSVNREHAHAEGRRARLHGEHDELRLSIEQGCVGELYADRLRKADNVYISMIDSGPLPYSLYHVYDETAGYTLLGDPTGYVVLCDAYGGGYARNFRRSDSSAESVWHYEFDIGSGLTYILRGEFDEVTRSAKWERLGDLDPKRLAEALKQGMGGDR